MSIIILRLCDVASRLGAALRRGNEPATPSSRTNRTSSDLKEPENTPKAEGICPLYVSITPVLARKSAESLGVELPNTNGD